MKMLKQKVGQLVCSTLPEARWTGELTNSARSTFLNCRKKFEWQYMRRLSPRAPSIPFLVGGLVHNGLERIYKAGRYDEVRERRIVEAACEKACLDSSLNPQQSDDVWEQQALIMGILRGYVKLYLKSDLAKFTVKECEHSFTYPLPNGWTAQGKRDMVVIRKSDRKVGLVEHKTAGRVDAKYVAKLPLDNQIIGYANSIKKQTGRLPDFIMYNVMKKSQLRKSKKETFEAFMRRIEQDYVLNPVNYFYRETLTFSAVDVQRFEKELVLFVGEMQRAIEDGYYYKNTGQCTAMGVCPYMGLCISGPTRENLSKFRERAALHEELAEVAPEA